MSQVGTSLTLELQQVMARAVIAAINNLRSDGAPLVVDPMIEEWREDVDERQKGPKSVEVGHRRKSASKNSRCVPPKRRSVLSSSSSYDSSKDNYDRDHTLSHSYRSKSINHSNQKTSKC